jgi:hypothetical protein
MKRVNFLLIVIILLAATLRLWGLGSTPVSPDWDEVALGYDAYSIIHTGRDEYGKFMPVVLRSFDDYKPALYAYLAIPTVAIFGLSTFAVRLPSAIFGILAVLATYFLVKELFVGFKISDLRFKKNHPVIESHNHKASDGTSPYILHPTSYIPLLAAALLAISPWSIQFSRVAFESNVGDALNIFAALFFLKGLKKPWLLSVSAFSAALSIYVYQSEKVFTPLFMLLLVAIYHKDLFKVDKKKIVIAFFVAIVSILPMISAIASDTNVLLRAKGTSIFLDQTVLLKDQIKVVQHESEQGDVLGLILDNRRVVYIKKIFDGYLSHFNPNWLLNGDIGRHHAPDMGLIYLWELPFILIGIYSLLFHKFNKKTKLLIFGWFLLVPIPASITSQVPHAVRTLNFLPTWQIFTALGLISAYSQVIKLSGYKVIKLSAAIIFSLFVALNFAYYLNQYFVQQNYFNAFEWQYGYEKVIPIIEKEKGKYKKIVVSDVEPMDKSYMFFLFYLKYPPKDFQVVGRDSSGGYAEHHSFDMYEFRPIDWSKEVKNSDTLYIGRPDDFPKGINAVEIINYPDGKPAMKIVER